MTFLPIVERELRVAARRRSTYWVRAAAALGAIVVGCFVFLGTLHQPPKIFGTGLFMSLSFLAMFYAITAGVRVTADCLSEEKREGTLGLLFLTDLKGYDVVFGKLAASSLNAFYGMLAIFPILAVPLLLGGVTKGEIWRMVLVLLNAFGFSLAVGIMVSSLSRRPRTAMAGTFFLLLVVSSVLPVGALWWLEGPRTTSWVRHLFLFSPFFNFHLVGDGEYARDAARFWWSVGVVQGLTWLCLFLACWIVPHSWQDKAKGAREKRRGEVWQRWTFGDEAERKSFRRRLLDRNAFYWLTARARLKPVLVWAFLGLVGCVWAWGCLETGADWFNIGIYMATAVLLNSVLKFWIASEAGQRLGEDRKAGALELLLSTPIQVREILHGQWLALQRQFLWPLLTVFGVEILMLVATVRGEDFEHAQLGMWLAGLLLLVADVITLPWVAMWVALSAKNPNRATGVTVVRVLVLPWLLFVGMMMGLGVVAYGTSYEPGWVLVVGLWVGLGLFADIVMGWSAWLRLHSQFRALAMERFVPPSPKSRRKPAAPPKPPVSNSPPVATA